MITVIAHIPGDRVAADGSLSPRLAELAGAASSELTVVVDPVRDDREWWTIDGRPALVGSPAAAPAEASIERLLRRPGLILGRDCARGSAPAYIAALGFHPERLDGLDVAAGARVQPELAEKLDITVPAAVLEHADSSDAQLVPQLRARVRDEAGYELPEMTLRPVDDPGRGAAVRINDLIVPLTDGTRPASWREVVNSLHLVVSHRLHWLLGLDTVADAVEKTSYLLPVLVREATDAYSIEYCTAVLREHLRRGGGMRNLGRILWLLLDAGVGSSEPDRLSVNESPVRRNASSPTWEPEPVVLASLLRKALIEDEWRARMPALPSPAGRLSPATEEALVDGRSEAIADAEWDVIEEVVRLGSPRLMITRTIDAVAPLVDCLQALDRPPDVVAADELPPDFDLPGVPVAGFREARVRVRR